MKSALKIKKKCEWCGKEFTAYKVSTKFCSKQCTAFAYKDKLRRQQLAEYQSQISKPTTTPCEDKEFLTPSDVAKLFGIDRVTVYRYLWKGALTCIQFDGKTFIRKTDIYKKFETAGPYQKRHKKVHTPITEFYTTAEISEKFSVSNSWIFKVGKEEQIPKVFQKGKTLWSKKHFDTYFAKKAPQEEITEWYTVEDMKNAFGMTTGSIYTFISKYAIPKKKVKKEVLYSKKHVDIAKGIAQPEKPQYYTAKEAMEKYSLTQDQLYHYIKWHNIPKIKEGRYIKIARKELDELLAPPSI